MQVLTVLCVLAVLAADVQGRHHGHGCPPPFSCGHLQNISHPFRRRGDPHKCGVKSYELVCSDSKAAIQINTGTYYVTSINYAGSYFWVVDANLDTNSSCPLPRWDHLPYFWGIEGPHYSRELVPDYAATWVSFVNCSQAVRNNRMYRPVACLSTNNSFVYVLVGQEPLRIESIEPSCGYLAITPLGGPGRMVRGYAYADIVKFMRHGFAVQFPRTSPWDNWIETIDKCWNESIRDPSGSSAGIKDRIAYILFIDTRFWACIIGASPRLANIHRYMVEVIRYKESFHYEFFALCALWIVKWIAGTLESSILNSTVYSITATPLFCIRSIFTPTCNKPEIPHLYTGILSQQNFPLGLVWMIRGGPGSRPTHVGGPGFWPIQTRLYNLNS